MDLSQLTVPYAIGVLLLAAQVALLLVLLARLMPGRTRRAPVGPRTSPRSDTTVTVIVATLNEAPRIQPCLDGLMAQSDPMMEVLVVDSRSTDGTRELVERASARDPRIRLVTDDPLPEGWVGKVWALETGLRHARGEWVLGIDADTEPRPGLVGAVIDAVERDQYDVASFSPRFARQSAGERFVQPAMLVTLVYRCGAAGATQPPPDRVLANGQCFVARRALLEANGGYAPARASFSDDVTLARHLAARGARVGFLDGSEIISVRSYASLSEMWREWGRSFDLKDATPMWRRWLDVALVWSTQALPLPLLVVLSIIAIQRDTPDGAQNVLVEALLLVNASALVVRLMMLLALRGSYAERGAPFWFSWLADIPAAIRLTISTARVPKRWRGREYQTAG
ncbi:MAG: glycosyltransferase [Gemmatimonadaceae bacterium]|nr:glycosyltransferase [Gemmatimonadaceae bacterium]